MTIESSNDATPASKQGELSWHSMTALLDEIITERKRLGEYNVDSAHTLVILNVLRHVVAEMPKIIAEMSKKELSL